MSLALKGDFNSIMFTHASGYYFLDRYGFYECIIVNPSHWPASALWCHVVRIQGRYKLAFWSGLTSR
jgi:hypothetical protein